MYSEQGRLSHVSSDTQNESLTLSRLRRPSSSLWISNSEEEVELVLQILATTVINSGSWIKNGDETYCRGCTLGGGGANNPSIMISDFENTSGAVGVTLDDDSPEVLDCGRAANFTYYDQLIGVANRHNHPHIPEPQVAMVFRKKGSKKDTIDLNTLERKLRKAKKEVMFVGLTRA